MPGKVHRTPVLKCAHAAAPPNCAPPRCNCAPPPQLCPPSVTVQTTGRHSLEDLQLIAECIGGPGLAQVCRLLAQDHGGWSGES